MKKKLCLILTLLLVFTLFSNTVAVSEVIENPTKALKNVARVLKHSIRSIHQISILSIVRGTVTLLAPKHLSTLTGSLRSIFIGNDSQVKRKKLIQVKGTNNGKLISLKGKGQAGMGYRFVISTPDSINEFVKKSNFPVDEALTSIIYNNDSINLVYMFDEIVDGKGQRIKNTGIFKGTTSDSTKRINTRARGRFNLNFSTR